MSLIIEHPDTWVTERHYVFQVIFSELLGIDWEAIANVNLCNAVILKKNGVEKELFFPDILFNTDPKNWLKKDSLPSEPLKKIDVEFFDVDLSSDFNSIPIIYGVNEKGNFECQIDIFGSCFFLLTRYEEAVSDIKDEHERFPASASLASRENFIERPLVNEYVELLWSLLKKNCPTLRRKKHKYNFYISCDVDKPFDDALWKWKYLLRRSFGDIVRRKSASLFLNRVSDYYKAQKYGLVRDPYFTFDWMMNVCEENNIQNSFYFITDHSSKLDGTYLISEERIRKLMRSIYDRGHILGLHGSYNSYNDLTQLKKEFFILKQTCDNLKIKQSKWGGRQHVLRFDVKNTLDHWDAIGMDYDSTLGFADRVGFRTGCCHRHSTYSLFRRIPMALVERPLMAMEVTLAAPRYMNMGYDKKMKEKIMSLSKTVKHYGGEFSLLWHNSNFTEVNSKQIFCDLVLECK